MVRVVGFLFDEETSCLLDRYAVALDRLVHAAEVRKIQNNDTYGIADHLFSCAGGVTII